MSAYFQKMKPYLLITAFAVSVLVSYILGFEPGEVIAGHFAQSFVEMITFIPFLFIIVGLFDVWVPKKQIEKHIGPQSGAKGILLITLLAMLQAGPLYGAFPVAYILYKKGAGIRNTFIFLGAFSFMKIPLLGIEIAYLGIQFSIAKTVVALPLFIGIGYFMEWYLRDKDFTIRDLTEQQTSKRRTS